MALINISDAFKVFDEAYSRTRRFILAYSGGKDSTAVAILLYEWVLERRPSGLEVVILHNDTMSEILPMEAWARRFMGDFTARMEDLGIEVIKEVATPGFIDTFYWRVLVRGYPASTFNFRWCVDLLKINPTKRVLARYRDYILIVGSRDEESGARARSMKARFGACMSAGSCIGAYFTMNNDIPKAAPIRFWSTEEVWAFLKAQRHFDVSDLVNLYLFNGNMDARYGCWHCTLTRVQQGLYLKPEYLYIEALRILYRAVSDIQEFRTPKSSGYSRLGPLNAVGRSIIYNAIPIAEEYAGGRFFYGLDEVKVGEVTLRELFYELSPEKADEVIEAYDDTDRRIPIGILRTAMRELSGKSMDLILTRANSIIARNNPYRGVIMSNMAKILDAMINSGSRSIIV